MEALQANFVLSGSEAKAVEQAAQWLHKCTNGRVAPFSTEDPGAANAVKLCGNFLIATAIESMAEALSLLEANGVDRVHAMQFYSSTFLNSVVHKGYGQRVSERDHRPGGFALELGYKDQRLAHQLAMESQVPMPFLSTLIDRFLSERAKGRSDLDWSAIGLGVCESRGVDVSEAIDRSRAGQAPPPRGHPIMMQVQALLVTIPVYYHRVLELTLVEVAIHRLLRTGVTFALHGVPSRHILIESEPFRVSEDQDEAAQEADQREGWRRLRGAARRGARGHVAYLQPHPRVGLGQDHDDPQGAAPAALGGRSYSNPISQRVRMTLQIEVEQVNFDPVLCVLRIKGKNVMESQYVRLGAYHTLDLEMNRDFTLAKNCWDVMSLERIEMACDIAKQAELAAVVMQVGLAHLCLIKGDMTVIRAKIETSVPKKRPGSSAHVKGTEKFYENIVRSIRQHIDFKLVKCVLLASPGFVKDDFFKFMIEQAVRQDDKLILENKPKFVLCHSSSGHKHALDEVLNDSSIQSQVADTKAVEDVKCLERFFNMLHIDQDRAYYGYKHVVRANANMAIETLMITDALFRSQDIATRRKYVDLVESVRDNGGTVRLFSSLHVSGEKLGQVSGIAAILRFPMPEIDEEDQDEESDSEEEEDDKEDESGVGDLSVEALGM
ncbi:hypothetical protein ON010_g16919 [Phytophthora cinnamomi]|nr:hypothetical protein ON010_g16919 [Phytophthora cinnamomi]